MTEKIDRQALSQKWVHSHEEDTGGEMVFRPASYHFPPSRGRKSFELKPDGGLVTFGIGPDDRSTKAQGNWQIENTNKLTLRTTSSDAPTSVMQLLHVGPDKLVVKDE